MPEAQHEPELVVYHTEVEFDTQTLAIDTPIVESLAADELEPELQVVDEPEPEIESSPGHDFVEDEPIREQVEKEVLKDHHSPVAHKEPRGIPEDVVIDIEAQILPHDSPQIDHLYIFPPPEEVNIVLSRSVEEENPVLVDEVIPDPIHIEPLQEPSEHLKEVLEDTEPPFYEKADITSEIDNDLREELDAAEKLLPRVS